MAKNIILLIDGDNIGHTYMDDMWKKINMIGRIKLAYLFGYANSSVSSWFPLIPKYGLIPEIHPSYGKSKSPTDPILIIKAMKMAYTSDADTFCIASNDSDFIPLGHCLQEMGKHVIGIGTKEGAGISVRMGYDEFIEIEMTEYHENENQHSVRENEIAAKIAEIIGYNWTRANVAGSLVIKKDPSLDWKPFGYKRIHQMADAHPDKMETRADGTCHMIRRKRTNAANTN